MTTSKGVLTIAHTKPKYVRQAVNLARSIRLRDPNLPLAIATDFEASAFDGLYDHIIPWDFSRWTELVSKLETYEMSPFETTLFLEADCLAIQSLQQVFDYFDGHQFAVFGRNEANTPWFQSMDRIQGAVPSPTHPVFNGGLQYFKKSAQAEDVFRKAKQLFRDYDNLQLRRNNKRENDEPLISLAMAQAGLTAKGDSCLDVMFAPERPLFKLHINVLAGESWFYRCGRLVRPVIVHFVGTRDTCYEYLREELRLEIAFRGHFFPYWHDRVIQMSTYGEWFLTQQFPRYSTLIGRNLRKTLRVRSRIGKILDLMM